MTYGNMGNPMDCFLHKYIFMFTIILDEYIVTTSLSSHKEYNATVHKMGNL